MPDAVAVIDGEAVLSYRFLAAAAARLASRLARAGAGPETVVAVMVPRSAGMVTAVLGVVWAGAAYLPLDPGYPAGRISFMLADAQAVALVSTRQAAAALPGSWTARRGSFWTAPAPQRRPRPAARCGCGRTGRRM